MEEIQLIPIEEGKRRREQQRKNLSCNHLAVNHLSYESFKIGLHRPMKMRFFAEFVSFLVSFLNVIGSVFELWYLGGGGYVARRGMVGR